ncbi:MAG: TolC family protein [Chitinophagales bacterium]|jgi:outer membrane protein TolC|nr:TolC family protein [Chitinophagales bacterium]
MKRNNFRIIITTVSSLLLLNVSAQPLSLDSVLGAIETNNPMLKVYDAQVKAFDAYSRGAKSQMPPQLEAGFFMTPYNPMMWKANPAEFDRGMGSVMLGAQQMFTNPVKLNANFNYMKSMSSVQVSSKSFQRNLLFADAKMNYYEWIILKLKNKVLSENENLLNMVIESSELRYPYRNEKLASIYKAKAQLAELKSMQLMNENEMKQKQIQLNTLMNRDKNAGFEIDTSYTLKNYETLTVDTQQVLINRSDIQAVDRMIEVKRLKQKLEGAQRLPDFGINYNHMFSFGKQPQLFSLTGMVTLPFVPWASKMYRANVKGLGFEMQALENEKQSITNEATGALNTLRSKINYQKQQAALIQKEIIPQWRRNYEANLIAFEQNSGELFTVLDAWQMLKMTQLNYLDQIQQILMLQVEYEKELQIR